jgi:hypothetical protein
MALRVFSIPLQTNWIGTAGVDAYEVEIEVNSAGGDPNIVNVAPPAITILVCSIARLHQLVDSVHRRCCIGSFDTNRYL